MVQDLFFVITAIKDQAVITSRFKDPKPIGKLEDVINLAIDKDVKQIVLLDVRASLENRLINIDMIRAVSKTGIELIVGGGISSYQDMDACFSCGASKIVLNTFATPENIKIASDEFGANNIVAAVDVKKYKGFISGRVLSGTANHPIHVNAKDLVRELSWAGAGNIMITSIDHDGQRSGYDLEALSELSQYVTTPVIINGGASCVDDIETAEHYGAAYMATRSMFLSDNLSIDWLSI